MSLATTKRGLDPRTALAAHFDRRWPAVAPGAVARVEVDAAVRVAVEADVAVLAPHGRPAVPHEPVRMSFLVLAVPDELNEVV